MLNDAPWSKWQMVMTPTVEENTVSNIWEKRRGDLTGYRRKVICDGRYQTPALYEFAVQTNEHCKRYVVYCKCNKGFVLDKGSWESRLLNKPDVRLEIEDILKKGFRLFVRRFPLGKSNKSSELDHYDYAWRCQRKERTTPRHVEYRI